MQSRLYVNQHKHNTKAPSLDVGALYSQYRNYAFSIAYRMLGSVTEAEDLVQDIFMTLQSMTNQDIKQPKTYIGKMMVNRSLNVLNSARNQREHYVGSGFLSRWVCMRQTIYRSRSLSKRDGIIRFSSHVRASISHGTCGFCPA